MSWSSKTFFKSLLFSSIVLAFMVQSPLSTWSLLEINFLSFMSLLISDSSYKHSSEMVTYFLTQALSSSILLMSILVLLKFGSASCLLIQLMLFVKFGLFPFHFWFIKLMKSITWNNLWIISFWQKMIPSVMLGLFNWVKLSLLISLLNAFLSAWSIYKQKILKLILAYSSIFSISWVVSMIPFTSAWFFFIMVYGVTLYFISKALNLMGTNSQKTLNYSKAKTLIVMSMLTLSGIPPFAMFFSKIFFLNFIFQDLPYFVVMLLMASALLVYSYSTIFFSLSSLKSIPSLFPSNIMLRCSFQLLTFNLGAILIFIFCFTQVNHKNQQPYSH